MQNLRKKINNALIEIARTGHRIVSGTMDETFWQRRCRTQDNEGEKRGKLAIYVKKV